MAAFPAALTAAVPPPEALALARRLGAAPSAQPLAVHMRQTGSLRQGPGERWGRFGARQATRQDVCAFEWRARLGPLGIITVVDRLTVHGSSLDARLLNLVEFEHAGGYGPALKGEIMRYLAELAWSPDAILQNPSLRWTVVSRDHLVVACRVAGQSASVQINLGPDGLIDSIQAADRPRLENHSFVERPWVGRFWDYRSHCGRRIPFRAEVSWILHGRAAPVWRGEVTDWTIAPVDGERVAVSVRSARA